MGRKYAKALMRSHGVALYGPSEGMPRFRVTGPDGGRYGDVLPEGCKVKERHGRDDEFVAEQRRWAVAVFAEYVAAEAARHPDETQAERKAAAGRTVNDLIAKREGEMQAKVDANQMERRTRSEAKTIHRLHIAPVIGDLKLRDWHPESSGKVLAEARARLSAYRVQAIGAAMRALVTSAHAGRSPWIPHSRDPMHGVSYDLRPEDDSQDVLYVEDRFRPTTDQVEALRRALGERCRSTMRTIAARPSRSPVDRDYGSLLSGILGYAGLRDGEGKALTVYSVIGHGRGPHQLYLYQACKQDPRSTERWYGPLKNRRRRYAVLLPDDVWGPLEERARALLERFGQEDEDRGMAALIFPPERPQSRPRSQPAEQSEPGRRQALPLGGPGPLGAGIVRSRPGETGHGRCGLAKRTRLELPPPPFRRLGSRRARLADRGHLSLHGPRQHGNHDEALLCLECRRQHSPDRRERAAAGWAVSAATHPGGILQRV